jgi:hypothetical protein
MVAALALVLTLLVPFVLAAIMRRQHDPVSDRAAA